MVFLLLTQLGEDNFTLDVRELEETCSTSSTDRVLALSGHDPSFPPKTP